MTDINADGKQNTSCNEMNVRIKRKEKKLHYIKVTVFMKRELI